MSCYHKALERFTQKNKGLLKKIKAAYWFKVKQEWVCGLDQAFEKEGMSYILELHPFIYYMCRMHAFMAVGEDLSLRQSRIISHYLFLHQNFSKSQIERLFSEGIVLWQTVLDGKRVQLLLQYDHRMRFEGQLSLKLLIDQNEAYFIHLLFSEKSAWVGSVQGVRGFLDFNKWFTKNTSGLRPQNFMYYCLTVLSKQLRLESIKGISNAYHVYQNEDKSKEKIAFSYDNFWQELGGEKENDVWFDLPCIYPRKALDEIGSKKRGQYRKRYELMDQIEQEMDISR